TVRYTPGQPERFPEDQPAYQPVAVAHRPETRTPLHLHADRRCASERRSGREDANVPAQPREVLCDACPTQTPDGTIGTEVVRDHQKPAAVARHLARGRAHRDPSGLPPAAPASSQNALSPSRCNTRQASP